MTDYKFLIKQEDKKYIKEGYQFKFFGGVEKKCPNCGKIYQFGYTHGQTYCYCKLPLDLVLVE